MTQLSDRQQEIVEHPGSFIARACPGAGKTRTIVYRFLQRSTQEPRRGIGLVSFTNAAVDEMRGRCAQIPAALAAPNFIGTFDAFINRFITSPLYAREHGCLPRYTETWAELPLATFQIRGRDFNLDWFDFDAEGVATLIEERIPLAERRMLAPIIAESRPRLLAQARGRYRLLRRAHCLSSDASRAMAMCWCADPEVRKLLKRLLAARFAEVIVDEAQDCGLEELQLMGLLREAGVALVLVADIDQSIYGFRRAVPEHVTAFAASLGGELALDGNYRSTPAICSLNRSLRHRHHEDVPVGPHKDLAAKVQLLAYRKLEEVAPAVREIAGDNGLAEHQVAVLAHYGEHARKAAAAPTDPGLSSNAVLRIVEAHRILTATSDPKTRHLALRAVERILLRALTPEKEWERTSVQALCRDYGVHPSWLRTEAVRFATCTDPGQHTAKDYAEVLRRHLRRLTSASTGDEPDARPLRAPTEKAWKQSLTAPTAGRLAWNTIHSAKGLEYAGVVVIIPQNLLTDGHGRTVLDHWQHDQPSEARRVLYVGASRAQQLAVLACHASRIAQVRSILAASGVNHAEYIPGAPTLW